MRKNGGTSVSVAILVALNVWFFGAETAEARGGWGDIPFVYCYEGDADDYDPSFNALGCLDGEWRRSNNSDQWDGSTPEPGDGAPGGVEAQILPGEGEGGGDATVLSLEDTGNPTGAGFPDPSNRKVFLWRDTSSELDLATGVTLVARWRLNPEPKADEWENNGGFLTLPNGTYLHHANKAQIAYVQKNPVGGIAEATLGVSITDEGDLQFAATFAESPCAGLLFPTELCVDVDEEMWVTVWLAAREDPDNPGYIMAKLYVNGETSPVMELIPPDLNSDVAENSEDANLPESGGVADSYINIALGSTTQEGAIQVDYVCVASGFVEPSGDNPACPAAAAGQTDGQDIVLSWVNGTAVPNSVAIARDGNVVAANAPVDPPEYRDPTVPPGVHTYTLVFDIPGEDCPELEATIDTCPRNLVATALPAGVEISFQNPSGSDLRLSRDGTEIATVSGDANSFLDTEAESGQHTYSLEPTTGECVAEETTIRYFRPPSEPGDFNAEPIVWDYTLDPPPSADPVEYLQHNPAANELGDLDGNWSSGNGSDSWDGSAPGEIGDPFLDVDGLETVGAEAPGGIALVTDGDVGAYLLEDSGDPTGDGWLDPSNRKLYLGYDLGNVIEDSSLRSVINDGFTFRVRLRVTPAERARDVTDAPNGYENHTNGKSIVSLVHDAGATGGLTFESQRFAVALDVNPEEPGTGRLLIGGDVDNELAVPIVDPTEWQDVWVTVEDPDDGISPEVTLKVYLNGSTTPTVSIDDFLPQIGGREADILDQGVSTNPANLLYLGLGATPQSGSVEVDLLCALDGVEEPSAVAGKRFLRGDADGDGTRNITDGVRIFNFLFTGGDAPPCLDAADTNDQGLVNITSGIYVLNFLFLGGPPPPAPFENCGEDTTPDQAGGGDLGCLSFAPCGT